MELKELRAEKIDSLQDLLRLIMVHLAKENGLRFSDGPLEILPDGYGFLRNGDCLPSRNDIYISPSQIKRFGLRNGDLVTGPIRAPKNDERYFALLKLEDINGTTPEESRRRPIFRELTPLHPDTHLRFQSGKDDPPEEDR